MKVLAGCIIAVLFACGYYATFAQTTALAMHGKVLGTQSEPVEEATVVLLNSRDSSVVRSTICSQTGTFDFDNLEAGSYLIFITKLNYNKSYSGPYQLSSGNNLDIGIVTLKQAANQLKEVAITGKKDFVEVRSDKTVLNVDKNIMSSGASVYDVLRSAPGVKIVNDEILLRGGQKALIAINGKPVLLSGEELVSLLKNYQNSSVSQIELIDNPSAKYDAASSGGMINIILKKNRNIGSNISVTGGAAVGDKYKFNTGINWDLKTEKVNIFASYNFTDSKLVHTFSNERVININNEVNNFDVNYNAVTTSKNNNFNLGTDYSIAPNHTIGILFNGSDNSIGIDKHNVTDIFSNGQPDSSIRTQSNIDRSIVNLNYNLNYKGSFGAEGNSTLSADLNYTTYNRHSSELLQNDFYNAAGQTDGTPLFYNDISPSTIHIRSEILDFSQVLSKTSRLDMGIKNSQVNSDNTIDFEQIVNNSFIPVPDLTDHFIYKERTNTAYVSYYGKFSKTSLSLGLRAEQTSSSGWSVNPDRQVNSDYFNVFPNATMTYNPDKDNKLSLFYSYNISRPNYQDLNPFIGYVDQFFYNTGNPFLKPAFVNTFQLSDLYLNKYKITLSATITNNFFATIIQQDNVTQVYTTIKDNIATRYRYAAQFELPFELARWWNASFDFTALNDHFNYYNVNVANRVSYSVEGAVRQNFSLSSKLSAQLDGIYESAAYFAINQYKANYYVNAALRYSVSNNGSISLSASDIFNTDRTKTHSNYLNLDITQNDKIATRFVTATFTYRFGSSAAKSRSHTTDEQRRLGSSSNEN